MYKDVLRSIEGADIFPIISLVLFMSVFFLFLFVVIKMKKSHVEELESIPFDDGAVEANNFDAAKI